jgi:hypothetical protein
MRCTFVELQIIYKEIILGVSQELHFISQNKLAANLDKNPYHINRENHSESFIRSVWYGDLTYSTPAEGWTNHS